jgi:hypothetical protein
MNGIFRLSNFSLWFVVLSVEMVEAASSNLTRTSGRVGLFADSFCAYQSAVCPVLVQRLLQFPTVLLSHDRLIDFNGQSTNTSNATTNPRQNPGS